MRLPSRICVFSCQIPPRLVLKCNPCRFMSGFLPNFFFGALSWDRVTFNPTYCPPFPLGEREASRATWYDSITWAVGTLSLLTGMNVTSGQNNSTLSRSLKALALALALERYKIRYGCGVISLLILSLFQISNTV